MTRFTGDPLLVNFWKLIYFPLPVWGNVSMVDSDFRGRAATMIYDHQPRKDYFVVVDENTLLGLWTSRELTGGWFVLRINHALSSLEQVFTCLVSFFCNFVSGQSS